MITTFELLLFIFVASIGYGLSFFFIIRIFVIASSLRSPVPFVPSDKAYLDSALKLLQIKKGDVVADLGSGSGTFLIRAASIHRDARFIGVELNKGLVLWTRFIIWLKRLDNVEIINSDLLKYELPRLDKVYLYVTSDFIKKVMPVVEPKLNDDAIVVSLCFRFGIEFESDHKVEQHDVANEKFKLFRWRKGK